MFFLVDQYCLLKLTELKKECDYWPKDCSSDDDCKECSDCPNGAFCSTDTDPLWGVWSQCKCFEVDSLGRLKACLVDINSDIGARAIMSQFDIYECPLDTYCKPFGETGLATMLGYVG